MNSLPKTVTRKRRECDLNPGPSAPESSTLTTRLPSHDTSMVVRQNEDLQVSEMSACCPAVCLDHSDTIIAQRPAHTHTHNVSKCFDAVGWVAGRASGL